MYYCSIKTYDGKLCRSDLITKDASLKVKVKERKWRRKEKPESSWQEEQEQVMILFGSPSKRSRWNKVDLEPQCLKSKENVINGINGFSPFVCGCGAVLNSCMLQRSVLLGNFNWAKFWMLELKEPSWRGQEKW